MAENQDLLSLSVREFAAATAARTPTPGGGSVAGVVGALAAALGEMALNFTRGKKKFASFDALHAHAIQRLGRTRGMFLDLVADDVSAYGLYRLAAAMAEGPAKDEAMQLALAAAIDVPREGAKLCVALLADLKELAPTCSKLLISDLLAAGVLAAAAIRLSDYNVRINVPQLADRQAATEIHQASANDVRRSLALLAELEDLGRKDLP